MNKEQERDMVKKAQKDPQAFGVIFDRYYDPIFGYVLKRVGDIHVSQDIVAETFFKALDRLWQFKWRGISISSWLYRIATNEITQYYRSKSRSVYSLDKMMEEQDFEIASTLDLHEEVLSQERALDKAKEWKELRKHIDLLPLQYQEVIALRYFEQKKIAEIAEILNKKEGTIKSLLSRANKKLKKVCNQIGDISLYV